MCSISGKFEGSPPVCNLTFYDRATARAVLSPEQTRYLPRDPNLKED